jgi:hypothetical protein
MSYLKALTNALLSIQFYKEQGSLNMLITSNLTNGKYFTIKKNVANFYRWGIALANTDLLDVGDKDNLAEFCKSFLETHNTKTNYKYRLSLCHGHTKESFGESN